MTADRGQARDHPALAARLVELGAATVGECGGLSLPSGIAPVWHGAAVAGPALPVSCSGGDNLALHVAVAWAEPGSVLVAEVGGVLGFGYWGEVLTVAAAARGITGLVIDGGVRDVAGIEARRFPVFACEVALAGATKSSRGSVGRAVTVSGVRVHEGDWVVADADGVVVVPGRVLDDVVAKAEARAANEREMFRLLLQGATTLELLGLDASVVEKPPRWDQPAHDTTR